MIPPGFFFSSSFHFFKILIFWVISGEKGQKILSAALYFSRTMHHMIFIYLCEMIISPGVFFIFSNFWFSGLLGGGVRGGGGGVKGQKIVQNDKKLCLSYSISQEPYIIWSSFVVCKCKMITSSGTSFVFSKLWFFRLLGGSKGKKMA